MKKDYTFNRRKTNQRYQYTDHVTHITSWGRFQFLEQFYKNPFRIFRLKENSRLEKQQRL